jgi:VWFA-related protein
MRPIALVAASCCLVASSIALTAQPAAISKTAAASSAQPNSIHLDVLVKNQNGMAVAGLAPQAFTVLDNGQPQKLLSVTPVATRNDPSAVSILIVLDMINPGYDSVTWGREQLGEFLLKEGGALRHRTSIAAMTQDGLQMMSGSTTDGNALQAELQKLATDLRPVTQRSGWQALEQLLQQSIQQFTQILAIEQTRPGRKLVLIISPGWPMLGWWGSEQDLHSVQQDFNILVAMTNAIHDSRTVVYRLDPYEIGGEHAGPQDPFYYKDFLKPVTNPKQATFPYLGLGVFAMHSGGNVLVNGHDIAGEINAVMPDAGHYYELTYAAPPAGGPNQYHAISVRVNQPNTTAQTISGYYADPQLIGPQANAKKH